METNVNYTIVGAFVILLTTCIILGIIWLSSGFSTQEYVTYKIYMKEAVSGLALDSPVEFNGVKVGTVSSIQLNQENPQLVELLIKIKKGSPITVGTRAKLDSRALTGGAYIMLEDKGTNMTPLRSLRGQPYPVIATTPSLLLRLDTALTQLSTSFRQISNSVQTLLDPENLAAIKQNLLNLRDITGTFAEHRSQMATILQNTSGLTGTIRAKTLPDTNQVITNLNDITTNLGIITRDIKQNPAVLIRGKERPALGPGE